jgi:hypothetical protein
MRNNVNYLIGTTCFLREVWRESELPERGRDFDVEGSWALLIQVLKQDANENPGVRGYVVLNTADAPFAVWREQ